MLIAYSTVSGHVSNRLLRQQLFVFCHMSNRLSWQQLLFPVTCPTGCCGSSFCFRSRVQQVVAAAAFVSGHVANFFCSNRKHNLGSI
jgi:hypothetical protein